MYSIKASISGLSYHPLLCGTLPEVSMDSFERGFQNHSAFLLILDPQNRLAVSWWVSPKRTRSYPYARVYDTLNFGGKKVTIIPFVKDEGIDGERDFLQWDTISLMSLCGIYVIISYYNSAIKSERYEGKITSQKFDYQHISSQLKELVNFRSDPLHWNIDQIKRIGHLGKHVINAYQQLNSQTNVKLHSLEGVTARIHEIEEGLDLFMVTSRGRAVIAQSREASFIQSSEYLNSGEKTKLTIRNYLGGEYYFTADEARIQDHSLLLVEGKHSNDSEIPGIGDIKDGLIKMLLFTNLSGVVIDDTEYQKKPILKLTSNVRSGRNFQSPRIMKLVDLIEEEGRLNGFELLYD